MAEVCDGVARPQRRAVGVDCRPDVPGRSTGRRSLAGPPAGGERADCTLCPGAPVPRGGTFPIAAGLGGRSMSASAGGAVRGCSTGSWTGSGSSWVRMVCSIWTCGASQHRGRGPAARRPERPKGGSRGAGRPRARPLTRRHRPQDPPGDRWRWPAAGLLAHHRTAARADRLRADAEGPAPARPERTPSHPAQAPGRRQGLQQPGPRLRICVAVASGA